MIQLPIQLFSHAGELGSALVVEMGREDEVVGHEGGLLTRLKPIGFAW